MGLKKEELQNDMEFQALQKMDLENSLEVQAGFEKPAETVPPVEAPPANTVPPVDTPPIVDTLPGNTVPPVKDIPPVITEPQNQHGEFLKEIFGDRYKTVEEAKNANIVGVLDEVETLRQTKSELETKLESKPKTNFASDEMALFNEFAKETGQNNYGLFQKINGAEVDKMDPMDAIVTKYILDHPSSAGKESIIREYFEKKYNIDPELVDESELAINMIEVESVGFEAIKSLKALKDKLKVPDPVAETPKPKELSQEEKATMAKGWEEFGGKVGTQLSKIQIPIKNSKDPLLDYEISEVEQKEISDYVVEYATKNQLELNEQTSNMVASSVYNLLMIKKLPEIAHSIFEKARSMTSEEVHKMYENPSPNRNTDTPPTPAVQQPSDMEAIQDKIYQAERNKIG